MAQRLTGKTAKAAAVHIGHYISGGGHVLLLGWALLGGVFQSEPEPFEVTGVDVISLQDFEAILAAQPQPSPVPETELERPVAPELNTVTPQVSSTEDRVPESAQAPTPDPTPPDRLPEVPQPAQPPQISPEQIPALPEPAAEPESQAPQESPRPVARPVTRVAPEAVAAPEPDQQIAEIDQAPTVPSDTPDPVEEAQEDTAREEAVTEIPTEPQQNALAPTRSIRPQIRPRPADTRAQTASSSPPVSSSNDSVAAALAEALAAEPAAPAGPPLTRGERESLRLAVQQCWVVDVGSQAANVVVTIGMSLDRDGKVQGGSLRLISAIGGNESAQRSAFEAARRAILRCQKGGYELPIEKYDHWRDVEMTFNPENMRRR